MLDKKLQKIFIVDGTTSIISKTATAPIERMKILLQTQDEIIKAGRMSKPYKGVIECVLRTYRNEGRFLIPHDV